MKQIIAAAIFLGFGALGLPVSLNAGEPISVAVSPSVTMERGSTSVKVLVERDDANRELMWEVDGPNYYRSSSTELDGAAAPRTWFFMVHDLPAGEFNVRATVTRSNNSEAVATSKIVVMGFKSGS